MSALGRLVHQRGIDIVHGYEWPPILEAYYGPFMRRGTAVVGTVMSMGVAPFIPPRIPLVVGTQQIAEAERRRRNDVYVIEPPVDAARDRADGELPTVRERTAARPDDLLVVVVSRLANELKKEGILCAIDVVGGMSSMRRVHLVVVGDGPARSEVEEAAHRANSAAGRPVVTLVGSVDDPRPWYAAADIALGMGSSALRAMAFGKPLVVQGERGFWQLLTPESASVFLRQGWYGIGDGRPGGPVLQKILLDLTEDQERRRALGQYGRSIVDSRFTLERAAGLQEQIYHDALRSVPSRTRVAHTVFGPAGGVLAYETRRRYLRIRGRSAEDDFNAIAAQSGQPVGRTIP
jgi:glycosyltransferase involved in cell wall biosynthesis